MAVKYEEVKDKLENGPFTTEELEIINKVETYIDEKINEEFDGGYLILNTNLIEFKFNPDAQSQYSWNVWTNIKSSRKSLMTNELKKRFKDAGWIWELQEGEDDGPNRPAIDYWKLSGKR